MPHLVTWLEELGQSDIETVGGKNASIGEMISGLASSGIKVPSGFATTVDAYQIFLDDNKLAQKIYPALDNLDTANLTALAKTGSQIRELIEAAQLPTELVTAVTLAYKELGEGSVAVRSSATAEDLPNASFAGQQETFLNIQGIDNVLAAILKVYASLFTDRAISYRVHQGFEHSHVGVSVGIQKMVRSDEGSSGVMFTLDTESGYQGVVFITSSYGLGEGIVQGLVDPDEFYVNKSNIESGKAAILRRNMGRKDVKMVYATSQNPGESIQVVDVDKEHRKQFSLTDEQIEDLARSALLIEKHYGKPMDIEWALDGQSEEIYITQARPETVKSRNDASLMVRYLLKETGKVLVEGRSIGQRIGAGKVKIISHIKDIEQVGAGDVLVTDMTDPDWEPVMKRASAIVTNRGGRTCHAAIIARELGVPAVVGCGDATDVLIEGQPVTVSCAQGDTGFIYDTMLDFDVQKNSIDSMPEVPFKIMMNLGNPDRAFGFQALPHQGIGLARLEFIINRMIGIHPKALLNFDNLPKEIKQTVEKRIAGYGKPVDFYVSKLVEGIATIASAYAPGKVIVRLSDFKSNEYANLIGGKLYEPEEENPMLGFRGACRYISDSFRECFELECRALKKVREDFGLENVEVMVPFVRTVGEAKQVIELLASNGLKRGENGLRIIMMCELPANALLADDFLEYFDGFSIGSNDLTQLTMGLDRDSGIVSHLFDERDPSVKALLEMAITACKKANKYIGICGQGPSDHPDFARWLMDLGIDSISLNPDSIMDTWFYLSENKL